MDKIYSTRVLTAAINKMTPVKTPVLDKVFGRKKRQTSSKFAWDIKSSNERLLKNIHVAAPAQVTNGVNRKTVTCEAPRYAEKRPISAADLVDMRKFGAETGNELLKERLADEQFDIRGDIDRTREYQAVKALSGQVIDESGSLIVDYNFDASQKPVLAGTALWTDSSSDPVANLRAWKKWISQRVAVSGFYAFCGSGAMDALLDNAKALELLKYTVGKQLAEEGRIARLAGVEIEEYFGTYKNASGTIQEMIPDNVFALVGLGAQNAAELFAPIVDLKAPGGVANGKPGQVFASKSWEKDDPSVRWIKGESRPLTVLYQPECVIWAQVA